MWKSTYLPEPPQALAGGSLHCKDDRIRADVPRLRTGASRRGRGGAGAVSARVSSLLLFQPDPGSPPARPELGTASLWAGLCALARDGGAERGTRLLDAAPVRPHVGRSHHAHAYAAPDGERGPDRASRAAFRPQEHRRFPGATRRRYAGPDIADGAR